MELVVFHGVLNHRDHIAAACGRLQFIGGIEHFQSIAVFQIVGTAMGAIDNVLRAGGLFIQRRHANRQGYLHSTAIGVEQMGLNLFE